MTAQERAATPPVSMIRAIRGLALAWSVVHGATCWYLLVLAPGTMERGRILAGLADLGLYIGAAALIMRLSRPYLDLETYYSEQNRFAVTGLVSTVIVGTALFLAPGEGEMMRRSWALVPAAIVFPALMMGGLAFARAKAIGASGVTATGQDPRKG